MTRDPALTGSNRWNNNPWGGVHQPRNTWEYEVPAAMQVVFKTLA